MSELPRVLITGIGLVTPLGSDRESTWTSLIAGHRAIRKLEFDEFEEYFWPANSAGAIAVASKRVGDLSDSCQDPELDWLLGEPSIAHAVSASLEAAEHASIDWRTVDLTRAACVIGTSKGGVHSAFRSLHASRVLADPRHDDRVTTELATQDEENSQRFPHASWLRISPNGPATTVASLFDLQRGAVAPVTACATGLSSILRGADLIRSGQCDLVLAGSSDASLTPTVLASFRKLGVLAKTDGDPADAVRPFDRNRNGFLVGEGAGIVVLESEAHAVRRNAKPIAEWLAGGMVCEAAALTQLREEPEALTWLIRNVLQRSHLSPEQIDYVSLHGTATKTNDLAEVRAIKSAFGSTASQLSASSLKGAIGHLLGAAGSVEFSAMLLAMQRGQIPPTMNLTDPENEFDLDLVPQSARQREVAHAMKLSLGFGGHLVAAAVKRVD